MKKKIFKIIIFVITMLVSILIGQSEILLGKNSTNEVYEEEITPVINKNLLSMMLEDENGDYVLEKRDSWPSKDDGYVFNKKLSKCQNGSKLKWDDENNTVIFEGTSIDKCHVYFDIYNEITLADYVKSLYTSVQGENGIYYHTSSLENGAGDNSYRYAGANPDNFVCFGSDVETCPNDNLYRIIGVFGDQVKLIKYDYATTSLIGTGYSTISGNGNETSYYKGSNSTSDIGIYYWNSTGTNTWSTTTLNTTNLNINYINNIGSIWANKIADKTWIVGGNTSANIETSAMNVAYQNEIVLPAENTSETAKIGLMYVSDYGYAANPKYWTYPGYSSSGSSYDYRAVASENWMFMGLIEWTITRCSTDNLLAFRVNSTGAIRSYNVSSYRGAVRPVFYLNSDVKYISGNGTKNSPIVIE